MSAVIRHIHYQPESRELSIWFGPEGRRYTYFEVPAAIYQALRDAPSRGRFFNQAIRDRYACLLVDPSALRNRRWRALHPGSPPISPTVPEH
tara:strand:- start:988 stop:1263 length:276 start_codon:yes stop_codon:yes gene_type:complete